MRIIKLKTTKSNKINIFCLLLFFIFFTASNVFAYEGFVKNPGTRAMAMAGVFSAQADDSSAAFYNPGALAFYDFINSEIAVEIGQNIVPDFKLQIPAGNTYEDAKTETLLSYAGAYSKLSKLFNTQLPLGVGLVYFSPYKLRFNMDAPRSNFDQRSFGYVDATYQQISTMLNGKFSETIALGASVDFLWTSIDCLEFSPCVDYGPTAAGVSLGGLFELHKSHSYELKLSGVLHSAANTSYLSKADSGIGTVLNDYLPDRPAMVGFGLNLQKRMSWMLLNTNANYEISRWSSATSKGVQLTDYHNFGVSAELLSTVAAGNTVALRCGGKLMHSVDSQFSDVLVSALGLGYEIKTAHMIDVAIEHRRFNGAEPNINSVSISYAWQI